MRKDLMRQESILEGRLTRREFLKLLGLFGGWLFVLGTVRFKGRGQTLRAKLGEGLREALFYERLSSSVVKCRLCYRNCLIPSGKRGICFARENRDGTLYTLTYGRPVAIHIDPVEKEPLFHFLPGTDTLCEGSATCNFECEYCINWEIALRKPEEVEAIPTTAEELVQIALRESVPIICFTYNEPTQQYEYVLDVVRLAKERGLRTTFHTNGGINPEPLAHLLPYIDSVAVDLKGFTDDFYKNVVHAELAPVLRTLELLREHGVWFEIVNLVIPTLNDDPDDISRMCRWILQHLGPDVPLHFSRFFPSYKLTRLPPTPLQTLERAYETAKEAGINYVYIGNVPGHKYAHTYCPSCGERLISRQLFLVTNEGLVGGCCKHCGQLIPGVWE